MKKLKANHSFFEFFYRLVQSGCFLFVVFLSAKNITFNSFSILMGVVNILSYFGIVWLLTEPILQIVKLLIRMEEKHQKILQDLETKNTLFLELLDKVNYPTTLYR